MYQTTGQKDQKTYIQTLTHQKDLMNEIEDDQRQQQIQELISIQQLGMISECQLDQLNKLQTEQLEKQRINKQTYLRREVLDKGYNAQYFMEYLSQIKQDGQNIDCWEYSELENVVNEFIRSQQTPIDIQNVQDQNMDDYEQPEFTIAQTHYITSENEIDNQQDDNESKKHENGSNLNRLESNTSFIKDRFIDKNVSLIENEYDELIQCKKMKDIQNLKQIEVVINDSQLRQGGIFNFKRTYTVYRLSSVFRNDKNEIVKTSEVFRRFNEFKWLRQVLNNLFPGRYVSTLFKKKTNKTTSLKKEKRKLYLQQFVSDIVNNPDFLECPYLLAFLQKDSDSEFQQIVKRGKGLKEIRELNNVVSKSGSLYSSINASNKQSINCFNTYNNHAEPVYNKLKKLSKQLMVDLDSISNIYFEIGDCYKQLFDLTNDFTTLQQEKKFNKLNETYMRLNNLSVNQGNQYINKIKVLQDNFYNQLKYSCREFDSYKEILKFRNDQETQYENFKLKINRKKQKLFNESFSNSKNDDDDELLQQKQKAFEKMLPQETVKLENLKKQFGYYNNYCYEDLQRQLGLKQKTYEKTYCNINEQLIEIDQEMETCWDDLIAFFNQKTDIESGQQKVVIDDLNQKTKQRQSFFQHQKYEDDEDY